MTQRSTTRIIGIDPGSRITGYGVIDAVGSDCRFVAAGCIRCGDGEFNDRLRRIYQQTGELLREWMPQQMAVEQVFVSQNAGSALKLGAARSAAICAGFEWPQLTLAEYAPREIKQAVTGTGGADKAQVQHMIKALLKLSGDLQADAADALAVAVCHANSQRLNRRLAEAMAGSA
ncbi:MAG: crossover junction endodeoxyribonuclease RuvC [Pseudomonadota bacterium]